MNNEMKFSFFGKDIKINKSVASKTKRKRKKDKTQINKRRDRNRDITIDTKEIQELIEIIVIN
jgi:hypothetical protein